MCSSVLDENPSGNIDLGVNFPSEGSSVVAIVAPTPAVGMIPVAAPAEQVQPPLKSSYRRSLLQLPGISLGDLLDSILGTFPAIDVNIGSPPPPLAPPPPIVVTSWAHCQ